jgi:RHS repeat-associated protein
LAWKAAYLVFIAAICTIFASQQGFSQTLSEKWVGEAGLTADSGLAACDTNLAQVYPQYAGLSFDKIEAVQPFGATYACVSTKPELSGISYEFRVSRSCEVVDTQGASTLTTSVACPSPLPQCEEEGNPTNLASGAKIEPVVDWQSPKEPRFHIARTYRSDDGFLFTSSAGGLTGLNPDGHATLWNEELNVALLKLQSPFPDLLVLVLPDGKRIQFDGTTFQPLQDQSAYTLGPSPLVNDTRLMLTDPMATRSYFTEIEPGSFMLTQKTWSDGYTISISRNLSGQITSVQDNRGQLSQFTWTATPVVGVSRSVIDRIDVDASYNGTTFTPDVAIDYDYVTNVGQGGLSGYAGFPLLVEVRRLNLGAQTTQIVAKYKYAASATTFPPPLTEIYDGRLNQAGQEFPYASFSYIDTQKATSTTASSIHAGGADGYSFLRSNNSVTTTNALGKQSTYTYSDVGGIKRISGVNGIAAANCLGTSKSFDYTPTGAGPVGFVYSQVERNGSTTRFSRDALGRVITRTEDATGSSPRVTTYAWHPSLNLVVSRTTSELGESFSYSTDGLLTSYTQTDNKSGSPTFGQIRTWTYSYTTLASGLKVLTSLDGPGLSSQGVSDITTFTYDAEGKLLTTTTPNGLVTTVVSYSNIGQPTQINNPDGTSWLFTYDIQGRLLTSRFGPIGSSPGTTTYTYDVVGNLLTSTNALNRTWTYTYDDARRLTLVTNPSGDKATYTYDLMGNVTRVAYSNGTSATTFYEDSQFDALGRLFKTLGANSQVWTRTYDVEDNLKTVTDATSAVETSNYDALNRVTSVVDRTSATTGMAWNNSDLMTQYTDPRSLATTFTYNGFGDIVSEASPDRGTMSYVYNTRGLVTSMTDARGLVTAFTYDNGGRITGIDRAGGTVSDLTFTWDIRNGNAAIDSMKGKLSKIVGGTGSAVTQITRGYSAAVTGDTHSETRLYSGGRSYTTYEYRDSLDRVSQYQYPANSDRLYFDFDADDRITRIRYRFASKGTYYTLIDLVSYKPNGPVASMKYGDGYTQTVTYDTSYRLTGQRDALTTTVLRDVTYGYDTRDNLISVTDAQAAANNETYTYTPREALAGATGPYGTLAWTYDGVGNRLSEVRDPGTGTVTDTYTYPTTSNRLSSIATSGGGTRGLTYDAAGNVTSDNRSGQAFTYTYDSANRLASVSLGGVLQAEYKYNWLGQQVWRRLVPSNTIIHSVYGPDGNRIAEFNETTGALIREYVWFNGAPIAVIEGGVIYLVRSDWIGRPVFATTTSGTVVWRASYLPFGGVRVTTGAPIDARFPGQWFQAEAGLYQNWMRDYDPATGRYMQADPLGLVDGASVYGYARENPGRWVDPRGEATPNTGVPNSWYINPGSGQMRLFGGDGFPTLDIDGDHDHGQGCPHIHFWTPNPGGGFPIRGPGMSFPRM